MTNSEIIKIIISKNRSAKISALRKVQILQLVAKYGTAKDIHEVYAAYDSFEFESGALSYACEYVDIDKIKALTEHGADFAYGLLYDLKAKYYDDQWNYRLAILSDYDTIRSSDNPDLAVTFAGEALSEPEKCEHSDTERAEIIEWLYNHEKKSSLKAANHIYSLLLIKIIIMGYCNLATEIMQRGIRIDKSGIETVNSADFYLLQSLSKLDLGQRKQAFQMLCVAAEANEMQVMPDASLRKYHDAICIPEIFALFLNKCDLKRYTKRELIEIVINHESMDLLSLLEEAKYFSDSRLRKNAIVYAHNNNYVISEQWLLDLEEKIKNIPAPKKKKSDHTMADASSNARWFTHKGSVITGLSKTGIKSINDLHLNELTFPTRAGNTALDTIGDGMADLFAELIPDVHSVIIPENFQIEITYRYSLKDKRSSLPNCGIKKITLMSDTSFQDYIFDNNIEEIVIKSGNTYKTIDGIVFSKDEKQLIYCPRGKHLQNYIVPSCTREIGTDAFSECSIDRLVIPDTVEKLSPRFAQVHRIKSMEISGNVQSIPKEACAGSEYLEELILHEGITSIGESAFSGCGAKYIHFPLSLKQIDKNAFRNSAAEFSFPSDDVLIGPHAFYGCKKSDNYSSKIEGKMQRCGYSPYDYYDAKDGVTRDQLIEEWKGLTGRTEDIDESFRFDQIQKKIDSYNKIKGFLSSDAPDNILFENIDRFEMEKITTAAVLVDEYDFFCRILKSGFRPTSSMFFSDCYSAGRKWTEALYEYKVIADSSNNALLFNAVNAKKTELCRYLLMHGADPNVEVMHGMNTVQILLANWHYQDEAYSEICRYLIESGADLLRNEFGYLSFAHAIFAYGDDDLQKTFIDLFVEKIGMDYRDSKGNSIIDAINKYSNQAEKLNHYLETLI